jgi:hypothetical protein
MQKLDLSKYKIKVCTEKPSKLTSWQDYALQVCKDFGLTGPYKAMIFRYCKKNLEYVRGKVINTKEKFGTENLQTKQNYLISLFRKTPPWKK